VRWPRGLWTFLFEANQFLIPLVLIPLALFFLWKERSEEGAPGRRLVILSIGIICVFVLWMSRIAPVPWLRYIIPLASLCAIVSAYVIAAAGRSISRALPTARPALTLTVTTTALLIVTNLLCLPVVSAIPERYRMPVYTSTAIRPELRVYRDSLRGYGPDPNRAAVDYLKKRLSPEDEVICNYEDTPLMFYLSNPIRGGIACFRLTDNKTTAPRYAVVRMSALGITYRATYARVLSKSKWMPHSLSIPDVPWGNNPDPMSQYTLTPIVGPPLHVYELIK
jgi:hypothetical protein